EEWAAWDSTGEFRVALDPLGVKEVPLRVRLLDPEGRPVPDALLLFRGIGWVVGGTWSLPARTDAKGIASSPTYRAFNVEVFVRGSVVASWVLGRDPEREATPEGKVRDLHLPVLAPVHLVVRDAGPGLTVLARMASAEVVDAGAITSARKARFDPG